MTTEKQETKEILNVIGKIGNDDFTDEEIKRFYQIFKYYSEDEKGVPLSKLGTTLRLFDQQISNRQTLRFQKQFSSKDLFYLTFQNMITIAAHLKKDESIDNYTGYLKFLDENDNGTIYASELKYALKNTGEKMTEKEIEQIFQQLEISNEGSINIQEFLQK